MKLSLLSLASPLVVAHFVSCNAVLLPPSIEDESLSLWSFITISRRNISRRYSIVDCSLTFPPGWEHAAPDAYLTVICRFTFDQSQLRQPFSQDKEFVTIIVAKLCNI